MHLPRNKQPREGTSTLPETNKILKIQIEDTHQQRETILINVHRPRETKESHRSPSASEHVSRCPEHRHQASETKLNVRLYNSLHTVGRWAQTP